MEFLSGGDFLVGWLSELYLRVTLNPYQMLRYNINVNVWHISELPERAHEKYSCVNYSSTLSLCFIYSFYKKITHDKIVQYQNCYSFLSTNPSRSITDRSARISNLFSMFSLSNSSSLFLSPVVMVSTITPSSDK